MARYYGIGPTKDLIAYNMERCEEVVLIDAYLKVRDRIPTNDSLRNDFEYYFFKSGSGISSELIESINLHLRRIGESVVEFAETTVYDYGRATDRAWKSSERNKMMDEIEAFADDARERYVNNARAEMKRLAPPHRTWLEYREDRERQEEENRLSREAAMREAARQRLPSPQATKCQSKPPLSRDVAVVLLSATDDEQLRDEIIGRIGADEMVLMIDKIADQSIKNKLIRRILDGEVSP